jgi:hypothetical protein
MSRLASERDNAHIKAEAERARAESLEAALANGELGKPGTPVVSAIRRFFAKRKTNTNDKKMETCMSVQK